MSAQDVYVEVALMLRSMRAVRTVELRLFPALQPQMLGQTSFPAVSAVALRTREISRAQAISTVPMTGKRGVSREPLVHALRVRCLVLQGGLCGLPYGDHTMNGTSVERAVSSEERGVETRNSQRAGATEAILRRA